MQDAEALGRMLLQTRSLMFVWLSISIGGKKGIKEHGLLKWLAIYVRVNCSDLGEGWVLTARVRTSNSYYAAMGSAATVCSLSIPCGLTYTSASLCGCYMFSKFLSINPNLCQAFVLAGSAQG